MASSIFISNSSSTSAAEESSSLSCCCTLSSLWEIAQANQQAAQLLVQATSNQNNHPFENKNDDSAFVRVVIIIDRCIHSLKQLHQKQQRRLLIQLEDRDEEEEQDLLFRRDYAADQDHDEDGDIFMPLSSVSSATISSSDYSQCPRRLLGLDPEAPQHDHQQDHDHIVPDGPHQVAAATSSVSLKTWVVSTTNHRDISQMNSTGIQLHGLVFGLDLSDTLALRNSNTTGGAGLRSSIRQARRKEDHYLLKLMGVVLLYNKGLALQLQALFLEELVDATTSTGKMIEQQGDQIRAYLSQNLLFEQATACYQEAHAWLCSRSNSGGRRNQAPQQQEEEAEELTDNVSTAVVVVMQLEVGILNNQAFGLQKQYLYWPDNNPTVAHDHQFGRNRNDQEQDIPSFHHLYQQQVTELLSAIASLMYAVALWLASAQQELSSSRCSYNASLQRRSTLLGQSSSADASSSLQHSLLLFMLNSTVILRNGGITLQEEQEEVPPSSPPATTTRSSTKRIHLFRPSPAA